MRLQRSGKCGISPHGGGFGFFRAVGSNQADRSLVAFRHVGVCVPQPLNRSRPLYVGGRDFALQQGGFGIRIPPHHFIQIQLALQPSLLDQHGFARLLGQQGVPYHIVVLPPGVVGGEADRAAPVGGRQTVLNTTLILADGYQLLRTCGPHRFTHGIHPIHKDILAEQEVVVNFQ